MFTTPPLTFEKHGIDRDDLRLIRRTYASRNFDGFVIGKIQFKNNYTYFKRTPFIIFAIVASECSVQHPGRWDKITFGCTALDRLTLNGIGTRGVTEIAGEAGSGKSQVCMQLALMVQLPRSMGGLEMGAVFICTEDSFSSKRLVQMAEAVNSLYGSRVHAIPFTSQVFVDRVTDVVCFSMNV